MTSLASGNATASDNRHPMSIVAFLLVLLIIPALGLAVTFSAEGNTGGAVASGVAGAAFLVGAAAIYATMARRLGHSPLIPDDSDAEKQRYLAEHRR
ncbi:hypothetical protein VX037_01600 [Gordonia sp. Z-3]|uniref:Uncharacterized protein n=1 Tax=Gordonia tangerina TaxID=2911060 RepID=A0ABS9DNK4_9ACTN|nr:MULTISPECIES: hypothetical protein [Gordonia]MAU84765.1 hypothetical protein [Gordonia sp. (in: high G+C Gram-positive bacteria)]MCF3939854.1 hypothetical protein [Gordonia tangerina]MED5799729.1 hypothetical protein [Gordonia sp. Z-3]